MMSSCHDLVEGNRNATCVKVEEDTGKFDDYKHRWCHGKVKS